MHRLRALWTHVAESLWAIPAALTVGLGLLALGAVALDRTLSTAPVLARLAVATGAQGARGVLTTIAGSLITVTGVVFSITIVALQLASSQYTPRVLRSFRADRANQVVLGVFIGTFTYALIVLGAVRSELEDVDRFVPVLALTGALLLGFVSIGLLIFFIDHIARSIQAESIIERVTADALAVVDRLLPASAVSEPEVPGTDAPHPEGDVTHLHASRGGYLQEVREVDLIEAAAETDVVIRLLARVGDFVFEGEALATLAPHRPSEAVAARMSAAFEIGSGRTSHQDVERGLIELTDIAVRALSPGINDPTTAIVCIDRLTEVILALGERPPPRTRRFGPDGRLRLVTRAWSFDRAVSLAFGQLRHHGAGNPTVALRIAVSLRRLRDRLPQARRSAVKRELGELAAAAERMIPSAGDRRRVREADDS